MIIKQKVKLEQDGEAILNWFEQLSGTLADFRSLKMTALNRGDQSSCREAILDPF